MYRAGHVIRRSSVKLKSLSGGHGDILMILSQIKEVRATFKAFIAAQSILSEDLLKWSTTIENDALRETFVHLGDLSSAWTDVQSIFIGNMKHLKSSFELLLEGERLVDKAKHTYATKAEIERDLCRELQKAHRKGSPEEITNVRERLKRIEKSKELAHLEVVDRVKENEAIRMIRVKDGMQKLGSTYYDLMNKGNFIFKAHRNVSSEIPDVHDKALHKVKFRGNVCAQYVQEAKEEVRTYKETFNLEQEKGLDEEPPPPYSPPDTAKDLSRNLSNFTQEDNEHPRPSAPNPTESVASLRENEYTEGSASTATQLVPSLNQETATSDFPSIENPKSLPREVGLESSGSSSSDFEFDMESLMNGEIPLLELRATMQPPSMPETNSHFIPPPPYNPFYEWSSFPPTSNNEP